MKRKDPKCMAIFIILISLLISFSTPSHGYDPLDPRGNITLSWDVILQNANLYDITVSIHNNQLFRHVERPGWKLGWTWRGEEVIWGLWGAEATEQGNCSRVRGQEELPHSCERRPRIVDLMPGASYHKQTSDCCRGGVLSSLTQDFKTHVSSFRMTVGGVTSDGSGMTMPTDFTLGLLGYTCGEPFLAQPTRFRQNGGRRHTQALETWNVICVYSQFRASTAPNCCVSLSAFYSRTIVACPKCSCNCQGLAGPKCVKPNETPPNPILQLPGTHSGNKGDGENRPPLLRCSQHMCPILVHWHVKQSYRGYWRVKITITNLNFAQNYSDWNLVVLHPNLRNVTQVFSFNYRSLNQHGNFNDTGMFWGIKYYNDMLLKSGENGNVQTEMLMHKDFGVFTFKEGWAFPRKLSFNGDECVMPPPDEFPRLPGRSLSHGSLTKKPCLTLLVSIFLAVIVKTIML